MQGDISFVQSGKIFRFNDNTANVVHPTLPAGNYVVQVDPHGNFYLATADSFESPGKLYGDVIKNTSRVLNTFMDRPSGTGVLLSGEKGSGKTLLAKNIVSEAAKLGIPTLIINTPFAGDGFNKFIQSIFQPTVVFFDEFEKVYDSEQQEQMLTLLDGSFPSKKLFLLTCNNKWRVDDHMRNRPGRVYYSIDFGGLTPAFVEEYCIDNLKDKTWVKKVVTFSGFFNMFNFDMLKALVEEMNRYNEPPELAAKMLNAKAEYGTDRYTVELFYNNVAIPDAEPSLWQGNPITGTVNVYIAGEDMKKVIGVSNTAMAMVPSSTPSTTNTASSLFDEDEDGDIRMFFEPSHIDAIDPTKGKTFYTKDSFRLVLTKEVKKVFDVWSSAAF